MGKLIGGAVIGLLLGMVICYWKQIKMLHENKDLISSGSDLVSAGSDFYEQLRKKL